MDILKLFACIHSPQPEQTLGMDNRSPRDSGPTSEEKSLPERWHMQLIQVNYEDSAIKVEGLSSGTLACSCDPEDVSPLL